MYGIVLLMMSFSNGYSQGHEFNQDEIDSFMNAALACRRHKNPGLTVSVVKDGKVMFAKGYGVADIKTRRPVTNTTLFGLASLSKAFAALLMVKLLHDRNMSIYTKPGDILKEGFEYADPELTQHVTIADLLTHRIGIPSYRGIRLDTNLTRKDITRRIRYFKPVHKFRAGYIYSNTNYGIVSYLSEVLGGKPWEDLISQNIYKPLGMLDSDFVLRVNKSTKDLAQGYIVDDVNGDLIQVPAEVKSLWGVYAGSGGIMSSSSDITKWMLIHLNKGRNQNGQEVIRSEDIELTHFPQNTVPDSLVGMMFHKPKAPFSIIESNYAMGWKIGAYKDWNILLHTGTTFGYANAITLVPGANLGIFTSMTGPDKDKVTRALLHSFLSDIFLKEEITLNKTTVCSYPEPWFTSTKTKVKPIVKTKSPSRTLSQYVGVYNHVAYGNLVISINRTTQKLQMDYGAGHWILYPDDTKDKFKGEAFGIMYRIFDLSDVQFQMYKNTRITVEVFYFEPKSPPRFTKNVENSYHAEL